ncbi:MAG: hypothetical protein ACLU9S_23475 [Oscillospiraceae bacterium]
MNNDDYKEALSMPLPSLTNAWGQSSVRTTLVLRCFQTENQQEVFGAVLQAVFP